MFEGLEDSDLGVKVFFQLPVEFVQVDGFDGDVTGRLLSQASGISIDLRDEPEATTIVTAKYMIK